MDFTLLLTETQFKIYGILVVNENTKYVNDDNLVRCFIALASYL